MSAVGHVSLPQFCCFSLSNDARAGPRAPEANRSIQNVGCAAWWKFRRQLGAATNAFHPDDIIDDKNTGDYAGEVAGDGRALKMMRCIEADVMPSSSATSRATSSLRRPD
jgi:hypothetical protein